MTAWNKEVRLLVPHLMCDHCGLTESWNPTPNPDALTELTIYFQGLDWHRYEKDKKFMDLCPNCAYEAEQEGEDALEGYVKVY